MSLSDFAVIVRQAPGEKKPGTFATTAENAVAAVHALIECEPNPHPERRTVVQGGGNTWRVIDSVKQPDGYIFSGGVEQRVITYWIVFPDTVLSPCAVQAATHDKDVDTSVDRDSAHASYYEPFDDLIQTVLF